MDSSQGRRIDTFSCHDSNRSRFWFVVLPDTTSSTSTWDAFCIIHPKQDFAMQAPFFASIALQHLRRPSHTFSLNSVHTLPLPHSPSHNMFQASASGVRFYAKARQNLWRQALAMSGVCIIVFGSVVAKRLTTSGRGTPIISWNVQVPASSEWSRLCLGRLFRRASCPRSRQEPVRRCPLFFNTPIYKSTFSHGL